jgi:hypothetical protein
MYSSARTLHRFARPTICHLHCFAALLAQIGASMRAVGVGVEITMTVCASRMSLLLPSSWALRWRVCFPSFHAHLFHIHVHLNTQSGWALRWRMCCPTTHAHLAQIDVHPVFFRVAQLDNNPGVLCRMAILCRHLTTGASRALESAR